MKKTIKLGSLTITAAMVLSLCACATSIQTTDFYVDPAETLSHKEAAEDGGTTSETTTGSTEETTEATAEPTKDDHDGSYHHMKQTTTLGNGNELYEESYFDVKGNMIMFRSSANYTDEIRTREYVYDSKGNLLKETETVESQGAVTLIEVTMYLYENDLLTKTEQTATKYPSNELYDELCRVTYYDYDDKGQLIKENTYYMSGELFQVSVYTYDDRGNLLTEIYTDENDTVVASKEYEYDSKGNVTKLTSLGIDGISYNYVNYEYNSNGDLIKASGDMFTYEYEYFDGKVIREKYYDGEGNYSSTTEYSYDEYDRVIFVDTDSVSDGIADVHVTYEYEW